MTRGSARVDRHSLAPGRFLVPAPAFQLSGFGIRDSGFGFRDSATRVRIPGFGVLIRRLLVPSVGEIRLSGAGFGFRVSGFGFRVSGSGFRVPCLRTTFAANGTWSSRWSFLPPTREPAVGLRVRTSDAGQFLLGKAIRAMLGRYQGSLISKQETTCPNLCYIKSSFHT